MDQTVYDPRTGFARVGLMNEKGDLWASQRVERHKTRVHSPMVVYAVFISLDCNPFQPV
jgi:hypothetical protein